MHAIFDVRMGVQEKCVLRNHACPNKFCGFIFRSLHALNFHASMSQNRGLENIISLRTFSAGRHKGIHFGVKIKNVYGFN